MENKPKVHLVRMTPEDHDKIAEMAGNQLRSVPSELHMVIDKAYREFEKNRG